MPSYGGQRYGDTEYGGGQAADGTLGRTSVGVASAGGQATAAGTTFDPGPQARSSQITLEALVTPPSVARSTYIQIEVVVIGKPGFWGWGDENRGWQML